MFAISFFSDKIKYMFGLNSSKNYFSKYLKFLDLKKLYPAIFTIDGPSFAPEIEIKGKKLLNFSSNNYLGLAGNPKVKEVVKKAIDKYGIGSGSTRLLSGTLDIQIEFEKTLADFMGFEDSITFSSGFLANAGVIRMLVDPFPYFTILPEKPGVIISDELNHASIIDGVRLAKAEREVYKHNDMTHLESILAKHKNRRKVVVSDGIFSMDGDMAKLKDITQLAKKYNALTYIDDAHGVGVLGPHGEGTAHHLGIANDIDVLMGSFTKAYGSIGGYITVSKDLAKYLRVTTRSYIFSDPIIPAVVAGLIETTKIIRAGSALREKVLSNAAFLRTELRSLGFTVLGEGTTIVPLMVHGEPKAIKFYDELFQDGVFAPCIRRPAVAEGMERIRFSLMASHERQHVETLLGVCKKIGKKMNLI